MYYILKRVASMVGLLIIVAIAVVAFIHSRLGVL